MGCDDRGPIAIHGEGTFHPQKWHEVTETCRVTFNYPGDLEVIVGQGQADIPEGTTFIGERGRMHVTRGKLTASDDSLLKEPLESDAQRLYLSENHHKDFLDCIGSRKLPICDVEIGHRTATACHLANIAIQLGRPIRWDAVKEEFPGDAEANALLERPYRKPWVQES
jgi:hypothetical protein